MYIYDSQRYLTQFFVFVFGMDEKKTNEPSFNAPPFLKFLLGVHLELRRKKDWGRLFHT
jgi:hypothetical protein